MTKITESRDQGEMVEIGCENCDERRRSSLGILEDPIGIYKRLKENMGISGWKFTYSHDGEVALCPKCWSRAKRFISDGSDVVFERGE